MICKLYLSKAVENSMESYDVIQPVWGSSPPDVPPDLSLDWGRNPDVAQATHSATGLPRSPQASDFCHFPLEATSSFGSHLTMLTQLYSQILPFTVILLFDSLSPPYTV